MSTSKAIPVISWPWYFRLTIGLILVIIMSIGCIISAIIDGVCAYLGSPVWRLIKVAFVGVILGDMEK